MKSWSWWVRSCTWRKILWKVRVKSMHFKHPSSSSYLSDEVTNPTSMGKMGKISLVTWILGLFKSLRSNRPLKKPQFSSVSPLIWPEKKPALWTHQALIHSCRLWFFWWFPHFFVIFCHLIFAYFVDKWQIIGKFMHCRVVTLVVGQILMLDSIWFLKNPKFSWSAHFFSACTIWLWLT